MKRPMTMIRSLWCGVAFVVCNIGSVHAGESSVQLLPSYSDKPFDGMVQKLRNYEDAVAHNVACVTTAWAACMTKEEREALVHSNSSNSIKDDSELFKNSFFRLLETQKNDSQFMITVDAVLTYYRDESAKVVQALLMTLQKQVQQQS